MRKLASVGIAVLVVASIGSAAMQGWQVSSDIRCLHGQAAQQEDQARREQALTVAKAINAAEAQAVRRTRQYLSLDRLQDLPPVPSGFQLNLYADRSGYIFAIKDTRDPCRFAVFSDAVGLLYQQSALDAPVLAQ